MAATDAPGFHFGIEAEFLLVDSRSFRPLWHPQLRFDALNAALESIPVGDFSCDGLKVEAPEDHFEGPQNKRRYDHWQWAMEAMTTYGPDVNVSLPPNLAQRLDLHELHGKVNYYAPALVALTLASPLYRGDLWRVRGRIGKSVRTYHRSTIAPAIEIHPDEHLRLEFKPFEMSRSLKDYHNYFLIWLTLILDEELQGRATEQTRIYDLGQIARYGTDAEMVRERATEVLTRAPRVLEPWGFDCKPLDIFRGRLQTGRLPADEIIDLFEREKSIPAVLRLLAELTADEARSDADAETRL